MSLGERIQQLRKSKGLSQEELAEKLNVSRQSISKWELDNSIPELNKIVLMSEFFLVSTDYLLKESEHMNNDPDNNYTTAKILFITSIFFIAVGLLIAIGGWDANQELGSIAVGMIIQIVGIAALFIGKAICSSVHIPVIIVMANIALFIFIPIAIITDLIKGYPIRPYPSNPPEIKLFVLLYGIVLLLSIIITVTIKHNITNHKRI